MVESVNISSFNIFLEREMSATFLLFAMLSPSRNKNVYQTEVSARIKIERFMCMVSMSRLVHNNVPVLTE